MTTLKYHRKEGCYDPGNDDSYQSPGHNIEGSATEDSSVEEQDR